MLALCWHNVPAHYAFYYAQVTVNFSGLSKPFGEFVEYFNFIYAHISVHISH